MRHTEGKHVAAIRKRETLFTVAAVRKPFLNIERYGFGD
jgi:hypothetical protein